MQRIETGAPHLRVLTGGVFQSIINALPQSASIHDRIEIAKMLIIDGGRRGHN